MYRKKKREKNIFMENIESNMFRPRPKHNFYAVVLRIGNEFFLITMMIIIIKCIINDNEKFYFNIHVCNEEREVSIKLKFDILTAILFFLLI